jgi:hypothetical protein
MSEHLTGTIESLVTDSKSGKSLMESASLLGQFSHGDVDAALTYVLAHPDYTAYHLLFALRRHAREAYDRAAPDTKAAILCDALKRLAYLNDWGYLDAGGSHDGEAATALLELERAALRACASTLDDSQPAPLFGTEEATLSRMYKYRRKDFAYRYLSVILGHQPTFDPDPQKRDADIELLKTDIAAGGGATA